MSNTPTTRLRFIKQAYASNAESWGGELNVGGLDRIDEAIAGVETIALTGNTTLTVNNYVADQARNFVLILNDGGLSANPTITIPGVEKCYLVQNNTGRQVTFTAGGVTASLNDDEWSFVVCDGTDVFKAVTTFPDVSQAFTTNSTTANALATGSLTYTVAAGKAFGVGMQVRISDAAAPDTNFATGTVTAYSGTSLTVNVASVTGSGTPASVVITFSQAVPTLPSQTGNAGELLTTDGTNLSWTPRPRDRQTFTSSGTWTKPDGATFVQVEAWGAGGGGGSGRRGASGADRTGGGGGGGGAYVSRLFLASDLGATETVTIGAGGAGGAAITTNTTDGNVGSVGGNTTFGSHLTAFGGGGGPAGVAVGVAGGGGGGALTAGSGATGGQPRIASSPGAFGGGDGSSGAAGQPSGTGGAGGGGSPAGTASGAGGSSAFGGAGGGGGGAITSADATGTAGAGGSQAGASGGGGAAGTSGGSPTAGTAGTGFQGGGGGGSSRTAAAGAGGAGGTASGGGGGGASENGVNSGAGGAGGNGLVRVTTW